jgi:hypothetical protein
VNRVSAPWLLTGEARIVSAKTSQCSELENRQKRNQGEMILNSHPDITFSKHAREITSPVASCPSQALLEEFWIVFQGRKHLTLGMVLHVRFVLVRHHPPRQKIVVVRVELVLAKPPLLIGELVRELDVLQDACAVSTGPA